MTPQEEIDRLISSLPVEEQLRMLELVDTLLERRSVTAMQESFLQFIAYIQPDYLFGAHLKRLGGLLMDIERGIKDRILVSVAPRHGKSQMISIYYPAWYLGRNPAHKVIIASHTADLAVDMSRKVRNLMQSDAYRKVFPSVEIAPDAKAAGKWNTNQGGEFFAVGVGGALAGRGAHLCLGGNTIVITDDGEVPLQSVQPGQRIMTAFGWQKITHKMLTIHKDWVKINGIDASLDHPFLTPIGWVPAGQLKVGSRIKTLTFWSRLWTTVNTLLKRLLARHGRA